MSDTVSLTLRRRKMALTLPGRPINPGEVGTIVARHAILQGFGGGFNRKVFLLYGLVGDWYDGKDASTLTLRRRKMALTLGG